MGWLRCDLPDDLVDEHEGHLQGVARDGFGWRDLGLDDRGQFPVDYVQVACACGWRSQRQFVLGAEWSPCSVFVDEVVEDAGVEMWQRHIAEVSETSHRELSTLARALRRGLHVAP
jgi:hypothetical protein